MKYLEPATLCHSRQRRANGVAVACILSLFFSACATTYDPKPNLTSVQQIGVFVPSDPASSMMAENLVHMTNITKTEDVAKNTAIGGGVGGLAGAGIGALVGLSCGPLAPFCVPAFAAAGGAAGLIAGAVGGGIGADGQEPVKVSQVHLYEVNKVLPRIKREILSGQALQSRALRLVREQEPGIVFTPVARTANGYVVSGSRQIGIQYSDVNLVLRELRILLSGKAEDDPTLVLSVQTEWTLIEHSQGEGRYDTWAIFIGNYESKGYLLSEWLAADGTLLETRLDEGLQESMNDALSGLSHAKGDDGDKDIARWHD